MSININSSTPVLASNANLGDMDLETLLLAVQTARVRMFDGQLKAQLQEVQSRNDHMAKLNDLQTVLNKVKAYFKADDGADKKFSDIKIDGKKNSPAHQKIINEVNQAMKAAGYDESVSTGITKGQVETMIQDVKNGVDRESNSQQMDMLRLQSMSGKRNEAFDVMTNFIKKLQDSRSAIIANVR